MPLKIVRNDITKMQVDAIVNTANAKPIYSTGVDTAVYEAAGAEELLAARKEIGFRRAEPTKPQGRRTLVLRPFSFALVKSAEM